MSERDEFEAWIAGSGRAHMLGRHPEWPEMYADLTVTAWWAAWQARAARAPQGVPPLTEPAVAVMPDGWAFSKDGYGNWKIDAPSGDQILVRASSTSVRADVLRKLCADLLKVPCSRAAAPAPQPSPEPKEPEHEHDWRFSLQDHVYKCDCGATRGDYPFGAASFKD